MLAKIQMTVVVKKMNDPSGWESEIQIYSAYKLGIVDEEGSNLGKWKYNALLQTYEIFDKRK